MLEVKADSHHSHFSCKLVCLHAKGSKGTFFLLQIGACAAFCMQTHRFAQKCELCELALRAIHIGTLHLQFFQTQLPSMTCEKKRDKSANRTAFAAFCITFTAVRTLLVDQQGESCICKFANATLIVSLMPNKTERVKSANKTLFAAFCVVFAAIRNLILLSLCLFRHQ